MFLILSLFVACSSTPEAIGAPTSETPTQASVMEQNTDPRSLSLTSLNSEPFDNSSLEGKVVLFVNVASECGFTKQYDGLQQLYETYQERGLVVVGVPCNQFGGQEPGGAEEIATFCRINFGVTFPLLEKQEVNGSGRSELYTNLISSTAGNDKDIRWNFEKFLVDRSGNVVERFGSSTKPDSSTLTQAIEAALGE